MFAALTFVCRIHLSHQWKGWSQVILWDPSEVYLSAACPSHIKCFWVAGPIVIGCNLQMAWTSRCLFELTSREGRNRGGWQRLDRASKHKVQVCAGDSPAGLHVPLVSFRDGSQQSIWRCGSPSEAAGLPVSCCRSVLWERDNTETAVLLWSGQSDLQTP